MNKKHLKPYLIMLFIILVIFGNPACFCLPQESVNQQVTRGLADLILSPVKQNLIDDRVYSKDLQGELMNLIDTRSHQINALMQIDRISELDMPAGLSQNLLSGARLEVDSAYDVKTGNAQVEMYGLGLVNATIALDKNAMAINVPALFQNLLVLNYDSGLNFSRDVLYQDRISDLFSNIFPSDEVLLDKDLYEEFESVVYTYADLIAYMLDPEQVSSESTEISLMGETQKVMQLSVTLNQFDIEKVTRNVLENARNDDQLFDLLIKLDMLANVEEGRSPREIRNEFRDSIDSALDELDDFLEYSGRVELTVDIYFTRTGFLSLIIPGLPFVQDKTPVAMNLSLLAEGEELNVFYKYFKDVREYDFELDADFYGERLRVNLSNIKDGNMYMLRGEMISPDNSLSMTIDGSTEVNRNQEMGEFRIRAQVDDMFMPYTVDLQVGSELNQIRKGTEYAATYNINLDMGTLLNAQLSTSINYQFSDSVSINLPDTSDRSVQHFENMIDLIQYISFLN